MTHVQVSFSRRGRGALVNGLFEEAERMLGVLGLVYAAFVVVVVVTNHGNAERRRTLTFGGLGVFLAVLGIIAVLQGEPAIALVAFALAGIELGLFALIRATRPSPAGRG